jgi:AcrR family transcriptional regulator
MSVEKTSKKDIIADAALKCYLHSSYSGTSMDDIVRASGMSKGGIYWYFKSKDEIFLYIMEKKFEEWEKELAKRLDFDEPARVILGKFVDFLGEIIVAPILVIFHEFLINTRDKEILKKARACLDKYQHNDFMIKRIIKKGIATGELKAFDPETVTNILIGSLEGLSFRLFTGCYDRETFKHTTRVALNVFFDGLANK